MAQSIGHIYQIYNEEHPEVVCYVGSTSKTLKARLRSHNNMATNSTNRNYNTPIYVHMREHGRHNFKITLIESIEYTDKINLHMAERRHIERLNPICNRVLPTVSVEERNERVSRWNSENIDRVKEIKRNHYEKERARLITERLNSPIITCGCGKSIKQLNVRVHNKTKHHKDWVEETNQSV